MTLFYLIQKEFKQIFRNPVLPVVFVLLPLVLINGVPRIATQEIKGLQFCVIDNDHSSTTSRLIQKIDASQYIDLSAVCQHYDEAMQVIDAGKADIILEFQPHFERDLIQEGKAHLMLSANATNGTKGGMAQNYMQQIIADYLQEIRAGRGFLPNEEGIQVSFLFNHNLDYKLYMIPALLGMLLILIVGFLPALNIVGEKEKGTIEQINVTPIRKWEFIMSKIIPYVMIGLLMVTEALVVARGVFGFWPQGNPLTLFLFVILFCMLVSSFGLIISNHSDTLQQAALTMFFFLVVFLLTSGLLTPIQSMPQWAQQLTLLNPMRYFVEAMRAIYIKGATLLDVRRPLLALTLYSCITWIWAILSYRKNS
ncbi:MAG: ABC transporter permease [Parabacteroides sp.]